MKNRKTFFRLFLCVLLFLLTFAGKTQKLEEYDKSFHRSRFPRPEFSEFEGIKFGITYEEFKQLAEKKDSMSLLGDTTVDRGHRGRHRLKVYMKKKGNAGSVLGKYYLFGLDFLERENVLAYAFFTPGEERLHRINFFFPDRLYSDMHEIEADVRLLYEFFGKEFGVPDYVSGRKNDDWGPQKKDTLTKDSLNHPRVRKGKTGRTFSVWSHPEGEWIVILSGYHFEHDKNRYQVVLSLSHNYTKGF